MATPACERAIDDSVQYGKALLKFISANDVGLTKSHQSGYYLPKDPGVWPLFTPHPPSRGVNHTHPVKVLWQDGRTTDSNIKWYGKAKNEYRLTAFGREFPFRTHDSVGDLLVLVPEHEQKLFRAYVLDEEEDIEQIMSTLGLSPAGRWALFDRSDPLQVETETDCVERNFRDFVKALKKLPTGAVFSAETWRILDECVKKFGAMPADAALVKCVKTEFELYKWAERQLYADELTRPFGDVEEFLDRAKSITQGRKSRAGRSLENHVGKYLEAAKIPFKARPKIEGNPDVVIPSLSAYEDEEYPSDKLFMVGIKTTCKDRWPQVLKEAKRVKEKHLLTLQKGMGVKQLKEMQAAGVTLVVPNEYHSFYPPAEKTGMKLITVQQFIDKVHKALN